MIVVTSRLLCHRPFLDQLELIASAGPELIILREKDLSRDKYMDLATECMGVCSRHGVRLSVNTHADVARALNIDAVHLPMQVLRASDTTGFDTVGASIHSIEEAIEAESLGADYLIAGHVFTTACKTSEPRGIGFVRDVCSSVNIPVYAIGGINPDNVGEVTSCGAYGVAVMSSIMTSEDPARILGSLRDQPDNMGSYDENLFHRNLDHLQ